MTRVQRMSCSGVIDSGGMSTIASPRQRTITPLIAACQRDAVWDARFRRERPDAHRCHQAALALFDDRSVLEQQQPVAQRVDARP